MGALTVCDVVGKLGGCVFRRRQAEDRQPYLRKEIYL